MANCFGNIGGIATTTRIFINNQRFERKRDSVLEGKEPGHTEARLQHHTTRNLREHSFEAQLDPILYMYRSKTKEWNNNENGLTRQS